MAKSLIIEGLKDAVRHARGDKSCSSSFVVHVEHPLDVRALRKRQGLTQVEFAKMSTAKSRPDRRSGLQVEIDRRKADLGIVMRKTIKPPRPEFALRMEARRAQWRQRESEKRRIMLFCIQHGFKVPPSLEEEMARPDGVIKLEPVR